MTSAENVEQSKEVYHQLSSLWQKANMHARKWLSNSSDLLSCIPQEDRAAQLDLSSGDLPQVKTLGVLWLASDDIFTFKFSAPEKGSQLTKRLFLRHIASMFDPLGFLAPFVVRAKVLFQEMWLDGYDWDAYLSPELVQRADKWFSELHELANIRVPRCLRSSSGTVPEVTRIHAFVDASEHAYGAVVYLEESFADGRVSRQLVASKMRVAPLASHSIPRLELMAAVVGLQLVESVLSPLAMTMDQVQFWTDSADVLYWIHGQSRKYKPFVAHRVGSIQSATNPDQWKHVPTRLNPADLLTRGLSASQLAECNQWWNGPETSSIPETVIPSSCSAPAEMKKAKVVTESPAEESGQYCHAAVSGLLKLDPDRFCSWQKMCRVLAWVNRFIDNVQRDRDCRQTGTPSVAEVADAEVFLIRECQRQAFPDEYVALAKGKVLPSSSKILSLNPQLDEDGVMRCGGRLENAAELPYDVRHPIILPRSDRVTTLIIKKYHERLHHVGGTNHTLAAISERFWIVAAREALREFERSCQVCKRQKVKPSEQIMAPLPSHRVKSSMRAFEYTAVDFAGPFTTKQGRGKTRAKRYMAVFTCTGTRAVHLEMAYDLSTDSFLNTLSRFTSRRGIPGDIVSDNGSNFVGAVHELKKLVGDFDQQKICNKLTALGTTWHFNPPAAPHFGGIHESMVKSAKKAVYAVLTSAEVTDEELHTCFVAAESLVNSRPLTYQSAHQADFIPLTPNHFLHGQLGGKFAPTTDETEFVPTRRWRYVQELIRSFWHRWLKEWLPMLAPRSRWRKEMREIKVGDIVLVVSADTPRGQWPLARVADVYPGSDGHVRVAKLQLANKTMVRPISKLCLLVEV